VDQVTGKLMQNNGSSVIRIGS